MTETKTLEVELSTREELIEIEVEVTFDVLNDGIGWYEYGSQTCFDRGNPYLQVVSTEWNKTGFTPEEIKEIEIEIEKSYSHWCEESEIPDCDPPDRNDD